RRTRTASTLPYSPLRPAAQGGPPNEPPQCCRTKQARMRPSAEPDIVVPPLALRTTREAMNVGSIRVRGGAPAYEDRVRVERHDLLSLMIEGGRFLNVERPGGLLQEA